MVSTPARLNQVSAYSRWRLVMPASKICGSRPRGQPPSFCVWLRLNILTIDYRIFAFADACGHGWEYRRRRRGAYSGSGAGVNEPGFSALRIMPVTVCWLIVIFCEERIGKAGGHEAAINKDGLAIQRERRENQIAKSVLCLAAKASGVGTNIFWLCELRSTPLTRHA